MHPNSWLLFETHALAHFQANQRVLEIGPDAAPSRYESLVRQRVGRLEWETADITGAPTHLMPAEYTLPIATSSFDVVVAGQVIEHVRKIWLWVPELARVTRPGGLVIIIAPVSWPFHEAPIDCWRIYPDGMRALADEAHLQVLTCLFDSLEPRTTRRSYPGGNRYPPAARLYAGGKRDNLLPDRGLKGAVRRLLGWPQPIAYDTILVARKPLS